MLSEAFRTPKTERRDDAQVERTKEEVNPVESSLPPASVSSSSVRTVDEEESPIPPVKPNSGSKRTPPSPVHHRGAQSVDSEPIKTGKHPSSLDELLQRRRGSDGSIERRRLPATTGRAPLAETVRHDSLGQRPASAGNTASRQGKKQPVRTLPTAKPVNSQPSSRVKRLTELNTQKSTEVDGPAEGRRGDETSNGLEQKPTENGEPESGTGKPPRRVVITPMEDDSSKSFSPGHAKTLEVSSVCNLRKALQMAIDCISIV